MRSILSGVYSILKDIYNWFDCHLACEEIRSQKDVKPEVLEKILSHFGENNLQIEGFRQGKGKPDYFGVTIPNIISLGYEEFESRHGKATLTEIITHLRKKDSVTDYDDRLITYNLRAREKKGFLKATIDGYKVEFILKLNGSLISSFVST